MTARIQDKNNSNGNGNNSGKQNNSDNRRANKPLMEKRRRARINQSLAILKELIVDTNKIEGNTKHSKLEKADILEMTVTHLQNLKKNKETASNNVVAEDDSAKGEFRQGFEECARQVSQFLEQSTGDKLVKTDLRDRLLIHLGSKCKTIRGPLSSLSPTGNSRMNVNQNNQSNLENMILSPPSSSSPINQLSPGSPCPSLDKSPNNHHQDLIHQNNDSSRVSFSSSNSPAPSEASISTLQVIPTRLGNGQIVFIVPSGNSQNVSPPMEMMDLSMKMDYESDEPLDCSNKNSPVNLSCKSAQIVPESECVWRPW